MGKRGRKRRDWIKVVPRDDQLLRGEARTIWLEKVLSVMYGLPIDGAVARAAQEFPGWRLPKGTYGVCDLHEMCPEKLYFDQVVHELSVFEAIGIILDKQILINKQPVMETPSGSGRIVSFPDPYLIDGMVVAPYPEPDIVTVFCHNPRIAVFRRGKPS